MPADHCKDCRPDRPCHGHQAANDTAAILAAVRRETIPYNAPGGVGAPAGDNTHETPHRPRHGGVTGRLAHILNLDSED